MEDRIVVVDSFPGSGKSSWAIQYINELQDDIKVIYITPYLTEVNRILSSCPSKSFHQPSVRSGTGKKRNHLLKLIAKGENIVSTHALFKNIDDELINYLRANDYILILDEVFQTVEKYNIPEEYMRNEEKDEITKKDIEILLSQGHIQIEDDFRVTWIHPDKPLSKYSGLISLCERELLYFVDDSLLLWTFPIEIFREGIFSKIFILTYQFESQLQYYYYKYFNIEYTKYVAFLDNDKYKIEKNETNSREKEWKNNIKEKIHILDHKINRIGDPYKDSKNIEHNTNLSKTWYEKNIDSLNAINSTIDNYFKNITKSRSEDRLWTCFKDDIKYLKSKNVSSKHWLACNARATNDYGNRTILAYMINRYLDPFYSHFFMRKEIDIDQDKFALSEMLQWIWRSAIRNNIEIMVYIPSKRMRNLLINYLNCTT